MPLAGSGRFHRYPCAPGVARAHGANAASRKAILAHDFSLSKGGEVVGQKRLSTGAALWHQSGMAKTKRNVAAVALGRLGGLKGGKARTEG